MWSPLRHIENKLEIAPTSTAVFDSVMDAKKPSASTSRKISRKGMCCVRHSMQCRVKPLRSGNRDTLSSLPHHGSGQVEAKQLLSSLDFCEAEGKTDVMGRVIHDRDERDLHRRDFESPCSAADETVVRYLNDGPAIDALQNNEAFLKAVTPPRLEEEKTSSSRGDESSIKAPLSNTSQDGELKVSFPSATSTSAHRLEILKRRQHDAKLEKLKERIRKQWEHSEELGGRGQHSGFAEQPVVITNVENTVTLKVRKVTAAPAAPAYKGFNPAETKIRAPDGKIWHEQGFHISRELYRDIALQLTENSTMKEKPIERNKERKASRPVRKVQKLPQSSNPESKQGGNYVISASSWREGQKLVKKLLGPAPKIEHDRRAVSSDRTGRERTAKSGRIGRTGSDSRLVVTQKTSSRSSERSRSKVRSENNLKKLESALPGDNRDDHASVNKDFLPLEIRGILDDLQLDSVTTKQEKNVEKQNQKSVLPTQNTRSHSPTKRKPDKIAASEEPQVISKKRHYDTDEVRQYIIRQQEERKKKQNEEKKAQKEATEQKNKRLQELYRKQKEAFNKVKNVPPPEPLAAKRLQETYSKLLLEHTFLEEPSQLPTVQETQPRPGYQPSGESDKENKAQERPPSASSSSDTSLSEPQQQQKCESAAVSQSKEAGDSKQTYSPAFDSYSESSRSKVHDRSSTSSRQESPSVPSSKENEKKLPRRENITSSIEEQAHTGVDDSLPSDSILSLPDEKDSASIATEYSLKFDESMTEDEIEEKSFRSLLPSESHRRINLEKKRGNRDDSDEEVSPEKNALSSIKVCQVTIVKKDKSSSNSSNPSRWIITTGTPIIISYLQRTVGQLGFLTKREQKLMQRRQHAEELLEWKRRLDAEEAEIRQIEKQALAAWDKELLKTKVAKKELGDLRTEPKETASEEESPVPSCSRLNSESSVPEELGSLAAESVPSETMGHGQPESPDQSTINEEMIYSEDFKSSASAGKLTPPKSSISVSRQDSSKGSHRTGGQLRSPVKSHQISHNWSDESLSMTQSETTSDQSDIEGRIRALKDELRKRKSVVYQLKKEQKKRQKERLKAQEASLIKQLESYDEFIKKTEAELSQDLEASPTAKPQIKTPSSAAAEKPKIKCTANTYNVGCTTCCDSLSVFLQDAVSSKTEGSVSSHTKKEAVTDVHAEEPSATSLAVSMPPSSSRAGFGDSLEDVSSSSPLKDIKDISRISHRSVSIVESVSKEEDVLSHKSEILENLEYIKSQENELEDSQVKSLEHSDVLLILDKEQERSLDILPKKILHSKNEPSLKEPFCLTVESLHGGKEVLDERLADKDDVTVPSIEESSHKLSISAEEEDYLLSEHLCSQKESSYVEDFEGSSSRKQPSVEEALAVEEYKDDFEASLLSPKGDTQSLKEQTQLTQTSRSRSTSLGSDGEISEYLSDRSLSLSGSVHSDRLLELKSPTELTKKTECRDVEKDEATVQSPPWPSVSVTEEIDSLPNFSIGDRVLVSKVQPGTLRFKGVTKFARGFWAGVELDKPEGNNNGTYDGIKYFDCKEKHGIFAPPQKISHITESIDSLVDACEYEDSFFDDRLEKKHKDEQKDKGTSKTSKEDDSQSRGATETCSQDKAAADTAVSEASAGKSVDEVSFSKANGIKISAATESFAQEQSVVAYLKHAVTEETNLTPPISDVADKISSVQLDDVSDFFSEKLERQKTLGEECCEKLNDLSPGVVEKPATPLLDLLTKEKNQLEAQLKIPFREEEKSKNQLEKVSLLTDSLLKDFVKDTVNQLQQIKKIRNEKIQLSNQELCDAKEQCSTPFQQVEEQIPDGLDNFFLSSDLEDDREELSSPDMCPRPESPVFGASGQEELAKRLAELELNREFLSVLGDEQDWFDEDYGLSSRKVQQKQAEEPAVLPKVEPQKVPPKPCEELLAVPHTAVEVESMVHAAAEELWKLKELGHDLQSFSLHTDFSSTIEEQETDSINKQVYKKVVFDLTREIFGEIFAEDPNLNQPIWMKPCRIASAYFRRVKDPNDLDEIKNFIAAEVLKLFSLKKEPNNKTDWQKMMKFGRKKRDRVDHILVNFLVGSGIVETSLEMTTENALSIEFGRYASLAVCRICRVTYL
uniref:CAP-Gly domain-containing protein n=1 Tax=Pavo cristatus TaxID=9049 RepID=A0A8C9G6V8_PAVCR